MRDFNDIIKDKLYNYNEVPSQDTFDKIRENYPKRTVIEAIKYNKAYLIVITCLLISVLGIVLYQNSKHITVNINSDIVSVVKENQITHIEESINPTTQEISTYTTETNIPKNSSNLTSPGRMEILGANIFSVNDTMICGNTYNIPSIKNIEKLILPSEIKIERNNEGISLISSRPGTYNIKYYEENNNKTYIDSMLIKFIELDPPAIKVSDNILCYNEDLIVTINSHNYNNMLWNIEDTKVTKVDKNNYKITGLAPGIHDLSVTFLIGQCLSSQETTVTVKDKFEYSTAIKPNYCSALNAEIKIKPKNYIPEYYILDNDLINKTGIFKNLNSGIHFLNIKYGNGCYTIDTLFVSDSLNLNPYFISERNLVEKNKYLFRNYTKIDDNGFEQYNNIQFAWKINGSEFSTADNPYHEFDEAGKYIVELTASINDECIATYSENIIISDMELKIPNTFTPNGDGIGDYFEIRYEEDLSNFNIIITTSHGEKVFESNDINKSWDGKVYGNNDAPDGYYFYVISGENKNGSKIDQKGMVQLIRR
jgi:gliding motility-associated-like protein